MKKIPIMPLIPILASLLIIATAALLYLDPIHGFGGERVFPLSLQSSLSADYGSDRDMQEKHVPLSLNIIAEVFRDIQDAIDAGRISRRTQTPVQTMTLFSPSSTVIFVTETGRPSSPSSTLNSLPTEQTKTSTATPTQDGNHANWTPTPTGAAGTFTATLGVGTITPTPTPTHLSQPTQEPSVAPTLTLQPSLTFTPITTATSSATRIPATATTIPATRTSQPTGYPAPATPIPPATQAATATPVIGYP